MSARISNRSLSLVFIILLVAVLAIYFLGGKGSEKTFRDKLVEIDTANVTQLLITPKGADKADVKLYNTNGVWKVTTPTGKEYNTPESKIKNLFAQLLEIKPKRLAARGSDKWKEYEVDSNATRVQVFEGSTKTLDLIIGRFAFQQPRSMSTFVRLKNDTDVYEVDGFLSATFNQDADNYRDNVIIKGDHANWSKLTFSYPADSSFQLVKLNNKWFADDEPVDSTATDKYLKSLQRLTSQNFVDDFTGTLPTYNLTIEQADGENISVNGFVQDSLFAINSNLNAENFFDGKKVGLGTKIFIGKNSLLPKQK